MDDPTIEPNDESPTSAPEPEIEAIFHDRVGTVLDDPELDRRPDWSLRGDLADLPLLMASRAVVVPAVLVAISSLAYLVAIRVPDVVTGTLASVLAIFFLEVPPLGAILLAALLADRSSYLAGAIAGFLGPLGLTLAIFGGAAGQVALPPELVVGVLVESTLFGLVIGGLISLARTGWRRLTQG